VFILKETDAGEFVGGDAEWIRSIVSLPLPNPFGKALAIWFGVGCLWFGHRRRGVCWGFLIGGAFA
jgi:hypothetical protein